MHRDVLDSEMRGRGFASFGEHAHEEIHSGHFMVSNLDDSESEEDEAEVLLIQEDSVKEGNICNTFTDSSSTKNKSLLAFDELRSLFKYLEIAYTGKLTSPKWNQFRGLRFALKNKIRLNNIIWREYHMQFVQNVRPYVVQFQAPITENHSKPEVVVMEGKYWKRRTSTIRNEYQVWRQFARNRILGLRQKPINARVGELLGRPSLCQFPTSGTMDDYQCNSVGTDGLTDFSCAHLIDEVMMDIDDNLDLFFGRQYPFPNPKDLAVLGIGGIMQPGLLQFQPDETDERMPGVPLAPTFMTPIVDRNLEMMEQNIPSMNDTKRPGFPDHLSGQSGPASSFVYYPLNESDIHNSSNTVIPMGNIFNTYTQYARLTAAGTGYNLLENSMNDQALPREPSKQRLAPTIARPVVREHRDRERGIVRPLSKYSHHQQQLKEQLHQQQQQLLQQQQPSDSTRHPSASKRFRIARSNRYRSATSASNHPSDKTLKTMFRNGVLDPSTKGENGKPPIRETPALLNALLQGVDPQRKPVHLPGQSTPSMLGESFNTSAPLLCSALTVPLSSQTSECLRFPFEQSRGTRVNYGTEQQQYRMQPSGASSSSSSLITDCTRPDVDEVEKQCTTKKDVFGSFDASPVAKRPTPPHVKTSLQKYEAPLTEEPMFNLQQQQHCTIPFPASLPNQGLRTGIPLTTDSRGALITNPASTSDPGMAARSIGSRWFSTPTEPFQRAPRRTSDGMDIPRLAPIDAIRTDKDDKYPSLETVPPGLSLRRYSELDTVIFGLGTPPSRTGMPEHVSRTSVQSTASVPTVAGAGAHYINQQQHHLQHKQQQHSLCSPFQNVPPDRKPHRQRTSSGNSTISQSLQFYGSLATNFIAQPIQTADWEKTAVPGLNRTIVGWQSTVSGPDERDHVASERFQTSAFRTLDQKSDCGYSQASPMDELHSTPQQESPLAVCGRSSSTGQLYPLPKPQSYLYRSPKIENTTTSPPLSGINYGSAEPLTPVGPPQTTFDVHTTLSKSGLPSSTLLLPPPPPPLSAPPPPPPMPQSLPSQLNSDSQISGANGSAEERRRQSMQNGFQTLRQLIKFYQNHLGMERRAGDDPKGMFRIPTPRTGGHLSSSSAERHGSSMCADGSNEPIPMDENSCCSSITTTTATAAAAALTSSSIAESKVDLASWVAGSTGSVVCSSEANTMSGRVSNAATLRDTTELIQRLREESGRLETERQNFMNEISEFDLGIASHWEKLCPSGSNQSRPLTETPVSSRANLWFRHYVQQQTESCWKFFVYSLLIEQLFQSYCLTVSSSSTDIFSRSIYAWLNQNCSLLQLRPALKQALCKLTTTTTVLQDPCKLPEQSRQAVLIDPSGSSCSTHPSPTNTGASTSRSQAHNPDSVKS